ncbi:hypothetical protein F4780DRAFT_477976 [Xylariomycetidae sp. FL0641]|nr:hypothetical protein F4780DRAFT_477976 [Xylariomycetidae sp. FL0641]
MAGWQTASYRQFWDKISPSIMIFGVPWAIGQIGHDCFQCSRLRGQYDPPTRTDTCYYTSITRSRCFRCHHQPWRSPGITKSYSAAKNDDCGDWRVGRSSDTKFWWHLGTHRRHLKIASTQCSYAPWTRIGRSTGDGKHHAYLSTRVGNVLEVILGSHTNTVAVLVCLNSQSSVHECPPGHILVPQLYTRESRDGDLECYPTLV